MMVEHRGRVDGKVAIVTGAGSTPGPGVATGRATAIVMAREGARVLVADLRPDRAEETRELIESEGGSAAIFVGDMTNAADCEAMVGATLDAFGAVDILVNNIGAAIPGNVVDTSEDDFGPHPRRLAPHDVPRLEVRRTGDGDEGFWRHREHRVHLGVPGRQLPRVRRSERRYARSHGRHGLLARPSGHPSQRRRARPHHDAVVVRERRPDARDALPPAAGERVRAARAPRETAGMLHGPRPSWPATRLAGSPV